MTDKPFTTGQASGITKVPVKTIQRYIREFRPFFTPTASQPTRGRQFTQSDINTIFTIRNLYSQKAKSEQIHKALKEKAPANGYTETTLFNQLAISQATIQYMNSTRDAARRAEKAAQDSAYLASITAHRILNRYQEYYETQFAALNAKIDQLQKELAELKKCLVEADQPTTDRRSFISRHFGL